jgi:hypothetical protein
MVGSRYFLKLSRIHRKAGDDHHQMLTTEVVRDLFIQRGQGLLQRIKGSKFFG